MYIRETVVVNKTGLHARPAADFAAKAKTFSSKITLQNLNMPEAGAVNADSVIRILVLGISQGTPVRIAATGDDEVNAVDELVALIEGGFGEAG